MIFESDILRIFLNTVCRVVFLMGGMAQREKNIILILLHNFEFINPNFRPIVDGSSFSAEDG